MPVCGAATQSGARPAPVKAGGVEIVAGPQADEQLEAGKPIERVLAGGETDSYQVILEAGQFLHLSAGPKGVDLVATLFGPDGKQIIEMAGRNSNMELLSLQAVAEVAGDYRLKLRQRNGKAPAGKYVVKIEELRAATPHDRKRFAADLALASAKRRADESTPEALKEAIRGYDEALALLREIGDYKGEAYTLGRIGLTYRSLEDNNKALEYYDRALTVLSGKGADWEEAFILNNIAVIYNRLGERHKALEFFDKALPLIRASGNRHDEATLLNNMGDAYYYLGENQKALEHYNLSMQLRRDLGGGPGDMAVTLVAVGAVHESLGDKNKALEYYYLALPHFQKAGGRGAAVVLANIGVVLDWLGDKQKALEYLNQALTLLQPLGDRRAIATVLDFIGSVYNSSGDSRKALEYYEKALPLIQAIGDRYREAIILTNAGKAYDSLGDKQKALDYYGKALLISRAVKSGYIEAIALYRTALTLDSLNSLDEARSNIEAALEVIESLRTKVTSPDLRASYLAYVQQYYDFYIRLLMRLDQLHPGQGHDAMALHASERARARTLLEMLMEGRVDIHRGVEPSLLERERSLKRSLDAKTERQVRLLSRAHTPEQVAQIDKEVEQLLAQYHEVKAQIKLKSPGYAALTQPRPLTLKEIQREVVDADTLLLEYSLGEEQSYLWAVAQDGMMTFRLPKRSEIESAAQRVYGFISADSRQARSGKGGRGQGLAPQPDDSYTEAAAALSRMVLGPAAAHLGRKRLLIVAQGALAYIPFAALPSPAGQGPAEANAKRGGASGPPLIEEHEIIHLPSASALAILRREFVGRGLPPKAVAVLADPVFSKNDVRVRGVAKGEAKAVAEESGAWEGEQAARPDHLSQSALLRSSREVGLGSGDELPRLPYSRREAQAILGLAGQAGAMHALDFDASRETATGTEVGQYRIVHFATHGLLSNEHPELSGLVLSLVNREGEPQNGFLRLYDIYNLKLGAELVVLSACRTGLGKQIKGEGLVGVTRGFMYAGAVRVMASLWEVDDEATSELMKRFYAGVLRDGQRPAAALRAAQLSMQRQRRWRLPYYWAGFILQGEWR